MGDETSIDPVVWKTAETCREAVNQEVYGGHAPSDSSALTEVWRTATGAAFEVELDGGRKLAVVVAPVELIHDQARPDWGE